MANPVNGRVHLTASIKTGSDAAWKKARTALEESVKSALEGIGIAGVTIENARLDFVQATDIIGGAEPSDPDPEDDGEEKGEEGAGDDEAPDNDEPEEKPKKSKKDKAAKGKKKGRK